MKRAPPPPAPGLIGAAPCPMPLPVVTSQHLLGERGQLQIAHQGEYYLLRLTSRGKLILTK
ncbi:MAG: hemin uptake protein HemP [Gammaproteobacteria bacterium]